MKTKAIIDKMDEVLAPIGFTRLNATWNRRRGSVIEVVEVQTNKAKDAITINAGVLEKDAYTQCWASDPPDFIEEALCVVRARVGELINGNDLWWPLSDAQTAENATTALKDFILPFLEKVGTRSAMEEFLSMPSILKQAYPLPKIYLAILKHQGGDVVAACDILGDLRKKALGEWRNRAAEIAERLDCN